MIARHFFAYKFAENYCRGKRVLDLGCGEGYGTYYLSQFALEAVGVDRDPAIISYAKNKYKKGNLNYLVSGAEQLNLLPKSFDLICSFQVIEHIEDVKSYLENIKTLLADGGIFICSTPSKLDSSPHSATPLNKFHLREYLSEEFVQLLKPHFKSLSLYGLKRGRKLNFYRRLKKIGIFNVLPDKLNPVKKFYNNIETRHFTLVQENISSALDFYAVCGK